MKTSISRKKLRNDLNLPDKFTIVNPARLEIFQKRQDLIIKSLGKLKNELSNFHVIFTGADKQYSRNIKILTEMASFHSVPLSFITMPIKKVSQIYKLADLIVLPSRHESFGYAALESLSLEIKTVLTDIPPFIEIAKDNPQAHIWKEKNDSLENTIIRAINSEKGKTPSSWEKKYSLENWALEYTNLIKKPL